MNSEVIAAIGGGVLLCTPIVLILTRHLRRVMREIKQLMHLQTIAMDNMERGVLTASPPREQLAEVRL